MIKPVSYDNGGYRTFGTPLGNMLHNGHDYNVALSTQVKAITDGRVIFCDLVDGFGSLNPNMPGHVIVIEHTKKATNEKFSCIYGHITPNVSKLDNVTEGQVIGNIAEFYNDHILLPHLHFAIYKYPGLPPFPWGYVVNLDNWINPLEFLK